MASSIFYWLGSGISSSGSNIGVTGKITSYNGVATAGNGVAAIVAYGRAAAVTNAATASIVTYTVPAAADGTFRVTYDLLVVSGATFTFTVECAYTDEGNSARVLSLDSVGSGSAGGVQYSVTISNTGGALSFAGRPAMIRAKAGTSITLRTQAAGTYTAVVYNTEGIIEWLA